MNNINKILFMLLIFATPATLAEKFTSVEIQLPNNIEWEQVSNQSDGSQYLREWIPNDKTIENTNWLIIQQKLTLGKKMSAKDFLKSMMALAKDSCTHVKYNGPKRIKIKKVNSYWGRFMCAQQIGKNYGTFTDIRTIAQGKTMFIVMSELRIPPSTSAGVMNFGEDINAIKQFMSLQNTSSLFTRKNVKVK